MVSEGELAEDGRPVISDAEARTLASYWSDERDPDDPLTRLEQDGSVSEETMERLRSDLRVLESASGGATSIMQEQLRALLAYCLIVGDRGPVSGWQPGPYWEPEAAAAPTWEPGDVEEWDEEEPEPEVEEEEEEELEPEPEEPQRPEEEPAARRDEEEPEPDWLPEDDEAGSALDLPFPSDW
jgi:hypothetical protein